MNPDSITMRAVPNLGLMRKGDVIPSLPADKTFFQRLQLKVGGDDVLRQVFARHPYVYTCVDKKARNIAQVSWRVRPSGKEDGENQFNELSELFDDPCPKCSASDFWYYVEMWLQLSGHCIIVKEGRTERVKHLDEVPYELWPLNGAMFKYIEDEKTRLVTHWVLNEGTPEETVYLPHELIHIKYPNPYDMNVGLPPLQAAALAVRNDVRAREWNEAFFKHGADPGGVLMTDQKIANKDKVDEILSRFEDRHRGEDKQARTAILTHGLKYQSFASTHRDMQYANMMEWNRDEIMTVFNVPPTVLGVYSHNNYASMKAVEERRSFWRDTLKPDMLRIKDAFWQDLFQWVLQSRFIGLFDESEVPFLQEDLAEQIAQAKELVNMGWTARQAAEKVGLTMPENEWQEYAWTSPGQVPYDMLILPEDLDGMTDEEILALPDEMFTGDDERSDSHDPMHPSSPPVSSGVPSSEPEPTSQTTAKAEEENIQQTAFNGAQVTSAKDIVSDVANGLLPASSAIQMLQQFFQMTEANARAIIEPADQFTPATPEAPKPEAPKPEASEPTSGPVAAPEDKGTVPIREATATIEGTGQVQVRSAEERVLCCKRIAANVLVPQEVKFMGVMRRFFMALRSDQLGKVRRSGKSFAGLSEKRYKDVARHVDALLVVKGDDLLKLKATYNALCRDPFMKKLAEEREIDVRVVARQMTFMVHKDADDKIEQMLVDQQKWREKIAEVTRPRYQETVNETQKDLKNDLEQATDLSDEMIDDIVTTMIGGEITGVPETVRRAVRSEIEDAVIEGETVGEIQQRVKRVMNASLSRSLTIARTEVGSTNSTARVAMMSENGIRKHEWANADDEHVRDSHKIDGEIAVIGEPFSNGLRQPHDPRGEAEDVINCRCNTLPVVESRFA